MKIDFHCHSTASDGGWTPQAVADEAVRRGLEAWSLTDHDTIAGWREIQDAPGLIPGSEISTMFEGREIHIVALGFDPQHVALNALFDRHVAIRRERAQVILDRVEELRGIRVTLDDCQTEAAMIIRSHIATALVKAGVVKHRQQAFNDLISNANVARWYQADYATPAETTACVHAAGGVTILAHPGLYGDFDLIERLMPHVDGVEVKHPNLDPIWTTRLVEMAEAYGWLLSAGSDFHHEPCRLGDWRLPRDHVQPLLDAIHFSPEPT